MDAERSTITVADARGRRRRGAIVRGLAPRSTPEPPAEFCIVLLASTAPPRRIPPATAICVPKRPAARGAAGAADMQRYRDGTVLLDGGGRIDARRAFTAGSANFEYIGRTLVDIIDAEALAPYTALVRHVLKPPAGGDPVAALASRLLPERALDRPPARAPAVVRLKAALRRLEAHRPPVLSAEQFEDDLRFLALITDRTWPTGALGRLLGDVERAPAPARRRAPRPRLSAVPPREAR